MAAWLDEARLSEDLEPEAMALATADAHGRPSVRVVLCRGVDARGLRFFTNYESRKGDELAENPQAAVAFHWPSLGRQLRLEGTIERLPAAESDAYFQGRPRGHQVSTLVSAQSRPIESIDDLRRKAQQETSRLEGHEVARPSYWGGYRLAPTVVEFWTRGQDRLHERIRFDLRDGAWMERRLAP